MQGRHEKVIYENDRGQRVEIAYSFPYFLQALNGADGIESQITKLKGVGQDGSTITNASLTDRLLQLLGSIKGNSKDEVARYRTELLQAFNPKVKGWLQYEYGNVKRRIRIQVEKAPVFSKQSKSFRYQDFLVDLVAPNPFWEDLEEGKEEIALWIGDWEFPVNIPVEGMEFGHRATMLIKNIINNGDVPCGMRIEFKALATVVNPSIFDFNTREFIKVKRNLLAGEKLIINTSFGNKRVELLKSNGTIENVFHYIDLKSTFIQLDVGDNLIQYDAEEGIDNLEVSIYHKPLYIGV